MLSRAADANAESIKTTTPSEEGSRGRATLRNYARNINPKDKYALKYFKHVAVSTMERKSKGKEYDSILVLCIGCEHILAGADNLGPLIGCALKQKPHIENVYVYGTMESPLHAQNLKNEIDKIYARHEKPFVIGIDLSTSKNKRKLGLTQFRAGQIKPGEGVDTELPALGDVYATAYLVHCDKNDTADDLFNKILMTDRAIVKQTAEFMAAGIYEALREVVNKGVILAGSKK